MGNWKDFSGRSLLQCAYNLRSTKVQDEKAPTLLGSISADSRLSSSSSRSTLASKQSGKDAEKSPEKSAIAPAPAPSALTLPLAAEIERRKNIPQAPAQADMSMGRKIPNESELMRDAFRAVVQDDTLALSAVLDSKVPIEVWREWKNKAGKDLLSLSEERGSTAAYSWMAKALGLIKDRKRDSYEEREAVWVLLTGDVQPRRATVLEDTPEEADQIQLEFWDGYEPPSNIHRDFVFKCAG